jgi:hypothetical protein
VAETGDDQVLHIVRALKYIINYKLLNVVGFVFMNIYQMFSANDV